MTANRGIFLVAFALWIAHGVLWVALHPWPRNISAGALCVAIAAVCIVLREWSEPWR